MVSRILSQWTSEARLGGCDMTLDRSDADLLCERIADMLDPEEIVDLLGLSSEEIVEELRSVIIDNADRFTAYFEEEAYD